MLEELKKFRYHNVEGPVQSVAVQQLRRVLADLLQCPKRALRHGHTQKGCQIKRKHRRRHRGENETKSEDRRREIGIKSTAHISTFNLIVKLFTSWSKEVQLAIRE